MIEHSYEAGIIVRLLTDNSSVAQCDLTPGEFDNLQLREVYTAIEALNNRGDAADWLSVASYIGEQGGPSYHGFLAALLKDTPSTTQLPMYANAVRKANEMRKARLIGSKLIAGAEAEGAIDDAIRELLALSLPVQKFDYTLNAALKIAVDDIDAAFNGHAPGVTTGLMDLDSMLGGFHGGDLIIVGARPAMGKTALMLNMAAAALMANNPAGVFSGEQGVSQITQRMIAIQGRVPIMRMRNGSMLDEDWPKLSAAVSQLKDRNLHVFDKPAPTLSDIVRRARFWHYNHGIKIVYIDYLQRIKVDKRMPRHEAVGEIAAGLKELARELDIPVVALAQVNRDVEKRVNKRPFMGDLKDSGTIEQEADQVFMLYRDEVYNEDSKDKGLAEINIEKNRHGSTGRVDLVWRGEYLRFENREMRAVA